jgi:hypothetical protein
MMIIHSTTLAVSGVFVGIFSTHRVAELLTDS